MNIPSVARPDEAPESNSDKAPDLLTADEQRDLQVNEDVVRRFFDSGYLRTGTALLTIQERRLYRETHGSFEAYVKARLQMSRFTAYRLMGAVQVVDGLDVAASVAGVAKLATPREGTIRTLTKVPPEERQPVLAAIVRRVAVRGERLTGRLVNVVLQDVAPQYAGTRRAKTLDPAQRKLADPRLEGLAREVVDLIANKSIDTTLVLRRAAILARKALHA